MVFRIHLLKCGCCNNAKIMHFYFNSVIFFNSHIKPELHRKKYKTSVKWRTLNPVYNEEFYFETRPNEMDKQSLYITVWDKVIFIII